MRLSREDWAEIYYALDSKRTLILEGKYDDDEDTADTVLQEWAAHLEGIMEAIGPDGTVALAAQGER